MAYELTTPADLAAVRASLGLALAPLASGLRQVATGCHVASAFGTTNKQFMSRSPHYARDRITSLQVGFGGWYVNNANGTEINVGATASITASVEYPAGTFTQLTFSGIATGTVPDGGLLISDAATVAIPRGQRFWVRWFWTSTAGTHYLPRVLDQENGAGFEYAVSGLTDKTLSGTVGATSPTGTSMYPQLIIANTSEPSFFLAGDSRVFGLTDTPGGPGGHFGYLAKGIGPNYAYINAGVSSDRLQWFLASGTKRMALAAYCSHAIIEYGMADLRAGRTPAQVATDTASMIALFPAATPIFLTTFEPVTTSTDSWATLANQTPESSNANRILVNNARRAGVTGTRGAIDIADAIESGRDSGKFVVSSNLTGITGARTTDGVHLNPIGNFDVAHPALGLFSVASLAR